MAKRVTSAVSRKRVPEPVALGPGLHAATIELALGASYRVRTISGARAEARLAEGVEVELADECLRGGRMVLVADAARGAVILGALQTSRSPVTEEEGVVRVAAKHVRFTAEKTISIEAGPVRLRVDPTGVLRLEGEQMVVDMGALVRFLSARMELP